MENQSFTSHDCQISRVKENFRNTRNGKTEKSAIAAPVWKEKHAMDRKPVLLKQATNKQELTNWENILITKQRSLYKLSKPARRPFS